MNRAALMLAAAFLSTAPGAAQRAPVARATITLESHRFSPAPIYLAGGVSVRMIFVNRAGKSHDFTAKEFFRSSQILRGRVSGGEVDVAPGRSVVVDLIPTRGTYKVHCSKFGHRMLGMSTMIIVN